MIGSSFHSRPCPPAVSRVCAVVIAGCILLALYQLWSQRRPFLPGSWAARTVQASAAVHQGTAAVTASIDLDSEPHPARINWFRGEFCQAGQVADTLDRPMLVFLYARDDEPSIELHRRVLDAPAVRAAAAGLVCFAADVGERRGRELVDRFGVLLPPALILYRPRTEHFRTIEPDPRGFGAAVAAFRGDR